MLLNTKKKILIAYILRCIITRIHSGEAWIQWG